MQKKVKFAIYGCGLISNTHIRALNSIENVTVVGVGDINIEAAKNFAEKYGVDRVFESYDEMVNSPDVDAICICTPSGTHASLGIKALEHD